MAWPKWKESTPKEDRTAEEKARGGVTKPPSGAACFPSAIKSDGKMGGTLEQKPTVVNVDVNVDAGQSAEYADGAREAEEPIKPIPIDEEYLRKLYVAVEDNSTHTAEMRDEFDALFKLIHELNADTFESLTQKSTQLETLNAELERLKMEAAVRINDVDRLYRENSKIKNACEEYVAAINEKNEEIAQVTDALNEAQTKCNSKDEEIVELNKSRQDADAAHADEIAKLKATHDTEMADLKKKHDEEVEVLNSNAASQIESIRKSVNEFVPAEVCDLFDYRVGEPVDDRTRWQAIYAYLGFINGNLRQDAFVRRFREFDATLYDAMRDVPDQLAECRARVQRHINEEIGKKSGGLLVCWPRIGDACNPDQYTTISDFGQRISEVISAMIYKKDDGGKVLCQSKGKVATV